MADIRIKDLATTATTTASDDFMAVDGATNGTRKLSAATPAFLTSVTTPSLTSPASTNLTLGTGTSGAAITVASATGNVGIGTVTPTAKLDVRAPFSAGAQAAYIEQGEFNQITLQVKNSNGSAASPLFQANNSSATVMVVNPSGNVLIGTTSETGLTGAGGLRVAATTSAGSSITGSLVVGNLTAATTVGIGGGKVNIGDTTAGSSGAGALVVTGGLATGAASYIGGNLTIAGGTVNVLTPAPSTNSDNGPLYFYNSSTATGGRSGIIPITGTYGDHVGLKFTTYYGTESTALTLAPGGAATFAGAVTAAGNVVVSNGNLGVGGALGSFFDILQGGNDAYVYNRRAGSLILGTNNANVLSFASTGAATFAGAVTIGGTVIHTLSATPASASATGTVGTMSWDASYIYICTAANTWKRVAIATW